jgi:hypothetical protein
MSTGSSPLAERQTTMSDPHFDEFDDKFEEEDTWLDDFDDRDAAFDEASETALLDNLGIDWTHLGGPKRSDLGLLLGGDDEHDDDEIAA